MNIFKRKEEVEEDESELRGRYNSRKNIKDLKPEYKRRKREPPKPWGVKERLIVLFVLLATVLTSAFLGLSSRNYKLPGLPRLNVDIRNLNPFKEETIVIGKKTNDAEINKQKEKAEKIVEVFREKTNSLSGVYAFQVTDLDSGYSFGVNEVEPMQAASLIKLPVIAALYTEVEKGIIDLDTKYSLKNSDKRVGSGSLYGRPAGTVLTYRELVNLMGKQSDNTAFNILRNLLGDAKIGETIKTLTMDGTSLKDNETSPKDIGLFFQKLYNGEVVSDKNKSEILNSLTDTIYENWLAAGIPNNVQVAHKYGREVHVVNDAGIIFTQNPFVLVILTDGVVEREADDVIPQLAKRIYEIQTDN